MDLYSCKAILFIAVPIILWLIVGAVFAYTAKARDERKKKDTPKFEDKP